MKTILGYIFMFITVGVSGQGLISSGGNITCSGSPYIVINGSLDNSSTWTKATETVVLLGSTAAELKGVATDYHDLQVSNTAGVTLNTTSVTTCDNLTINASSLFTIAPTSKLTVGTTLTNSVGNAGLVIKSTVNGSGSLISGTAGVAATVEQYHTDSTYVYHMVSMPVTSATAAVFKYTGVQTYVYGYNSTTNAWTNITTSATALTLGRGYLVNYKDVAVDRTSVYTGNLNASGVNPALDAVTTRFHLVGNPYPCAINWDNFAGSRTDLHQAYYLWLPAKGSYGTYSQALGGINGLSNIIQSGQGFFVYSTGASPAITFPSAAKTHNNSILKAAIEAPPMLRLRISNNINQYSDETVVLFSPQGSTGFDNGLDAVKMFTLSTESSQIYTANSKNLAINSMPADYGDSIPVFFKCNKGATYTIELTKNTWKDTVWLTDLIAGKTVLFSGDKYTYTALTTDTVRRFVLNRKKSAGSPTGLEPVVNPIAGITIYSTDRKICLQNHTTREFLGELTITGVDGRKLFFEKNVRLTTEIFRDAPWPGIYIVTFREGNYYFKAKIAIY